MAAFDALECTERHPTFLYTPNLFHCGLTRRFASTVLKYLR